MELLALKVINIYRFKSNEGLTSHSARAWDNAIQSHVSEMERVAFMYNYGGHHTTLHFFGDRTSSLQFRVECPDRETKERLTGALNVYLKRKG